MALMQSANWTSISGSIGGQTFARSAQGYYARARVHPVQPASDRQVLVKAAASTVAPLWESMSAAFRESWETYAANVQVQGRFGPVSISGQAHFMRSNLPRFQASDPYYTPLAGLPLPLSPPIAIFQAPTQFDLGANDAGPISISAAVAATVTVAYNDQAAWAAEDGAFMLVYLGKPRGAGRTYFRGPWRLLGAVAGDSTTPPTSPLAANTGVTTYTPAAGQLVRVAVRILRADGRLSERIITPDFTVA